MSPATTADIEPHGRADHRFIRVVLRRWEAGLLFARQAEINGGIPGPGFPQILGDRLQSQIQDAGFDRGQFAGDLSPGTAVCAEQLFEENRDQFRAEGQYGLAVVRSRAQTKQNRRRGMSGRKPLRVICSRASSVAVTPTAKRGGQADRHGRGKALPNRPQLVLRRTGEKPIVRHWGEMPPRLRSGASLEGRDQTALFLRHRRLFHNALHSVPVWSLDVVEQTPCGLACPGGQRRLLLELTLVQFESCGNDVGVAADCSVRFDTARQTD